ncbi:MAG: helix-turn-helix domain-containing protein [Levilactobacillus sp.]|jgi:transcriptional regulator with XRE-family HTH domain|uniref:XRE family transcriptional regulator n=1 Tax=Levilactobacillus suantsaiihabitans TaxID=2487722 RepID=A0A4Z0J7L1_9LACO|nr:MULTISPECIES: helix-turn-helix transcriptional regulator [Levilactobacillus]MCH4123868.1 helix-turn-helix domain-containing protein [Levilactobacillus sp.]MCI1553966.1 helix-turn-helix domain-containing protein [Levilactobacillus sp.]MCI1599157.1 helix-turn-helix domain-containing protein [Levilactobacillus sp.]MCI1605452.1 helix-turn-helix domain-containing protein [Levilactobacillus sp.]TGD18567.1 XRE family transcriptional regulator [Levilactobacillus suantsaiihabitans]
MDKVQMTLEAARHNAGYSQKEAAACLGIHYQTLAAWERDSSNLGIQTIERLSALYQVPQNCLFFGKKSDFIHALRQRAAKGKL